MKHLVYSLLLSMSCLPLFAQDQDCIAATSLIAKAAILVPQANGIGAMDETFDNDCGVTGSIENSSNWYSFTPFEAGSFNFTIQPNESLADFDFYLFLSETGSCDDKVAVRCNASSCTSSNGYTGLAPNDSDLFEEVSCNAGENLYCSELQLEIGKTYYLLVNNFSISGGYTLEMCGTAKLGPNDIACTDAILNTDDLSKTNFLIAPNPSYGSISINDHQAIASIDVINSQGARVAHITEVGSKLFLEHQPGVYYLSLRLRGGTMTSARVVLLAH